MRRFTLSVDGVGCGRLSFKEILAHCALIGVNVVHKFKSREARCAAEVVLPPFQVDDNLSHLFVVAYSAHVALVFQGRIQASLVHLVAKGAAEILQYTWFAGTSHPKLIALVVLGNALLTVRAGFENLFILFQTSCAAELANAESKPYAKLAHTIHRHYLSALDAV